MRSGCSGRPLSIKPRKILQFTVDDPLGLSIGSPMMVPRHSLLALGAALAVAFSSFGLVACGGSSGPSQEELSQARTEGASEARQQTKIEQIQHQLKALKNGQANGASTTTSGSSVSTSGGESSCGGDLSVGPNTTCGFAQNVEAEYREYIGSGSGTVYPYSPSTGKTYAMYCTAGAPHVCTGGNEASVYFP
jgi:hypothetical protein